MHEFTAANPIWLHVISWFSMEKRFEMLHLSCSCREGIMFLYNYCMIVSNWISNAIYFVTRLTWK